MQGGTRVNAFVLKKIPVFPLLSLGISFLFFGRFIDNYFVYDDFRYIENNFHGLQDVLLGFNTLRVVSNSLWWPLYYVSGFNPIGYNLLNIVLYALAAVLLARFVQSLFKNRTLAFFSGLFFVLSAVGADVVFWKCANNSMLSLCFYLLTLRSYVIFRENGNRKQLYVSLACYCFAMFSKEDAASLPAVIVLMELLFFRGEQLMRTVLLRALPFCAVICIYLLLSKLVFSWLALAPAELAKFYTIRPLYSLVGGFSSFFLAPDGVLKVINPLAWFAAAAVPASLILVKDRKLLLFAFGWILFTFLPQSLTSLGQFEPRFLSNSLSRYLYIVSIGPALIYAAVVTVLKERLTGRIFLCVTLLCVGAYGWINYQNVQKRGWEWMDEAAPLKIFFAELDKQMSSFPPNSFVYVDNAPTGRAYVQQAMRVYYRNPAITWIVDPERYERKAGERAFMINITWVPTGIETMKISEPWPISDGR
jgi:hypothetical protein